MKGALLLLMTPNMSLEKWNELGQLSRELSYYTKLTQKADLNLIIYTYGRNDAPFIKEFPQISILNMPDWIPVSIPFRLQNLLFNFSSLFYYRSYFRRVVFSKTNQFSASGFGLVLKIVFGIPLVIRMGYYHSHFKKLSWHFRIKEWFAFKVCDLIITTSAEAARYIISKYKIRSNKILSMCNTIDLTKFKPEKLVEKEYDLIFVGRLEKVKNIELLVKIVRAVGLRTLIIGKGSLDFMITDAAKNPNQVVWKERVDNVDLPGYYNKAKCFLLVSAYEGNPKALLEAMACGLPCIVTQVPGIRECISNNVNGIFIDNDISNIKRQILDICSNPPKAEWIGKNAVKWVSSKTDMNENINQEVNFYFGFLKDAKRLN